MFDIVTVPDFSGNARPRYEFLLKNFLHSWIANGGPQTNIPLHIQSIGSPPETIFTLIEKANARLQVVAPVNVNVGSFFNKLRGFEASFENDHLLLLDSDMVFLSTEFDLAGYAGSIAAASGCWDRIPDRHWRIIRQELQIPDVDLYTDTTQRKIDLKASRTVDPEGRGIARECKAYFNSGAIFAPVQSALPEKWLQMGERVAGLFPPEDPYYKQFANADQSSFACTVACLVADGVSVKVLDNVYNYRPPNLLDPEIPVDQVVLFHMIGAGKRSNLNVLEKLIPSNRIFLRVLVRTVLIWRRSFLLRPWKRAFWQIFSVPGTLRSFHKRAFTEAD